LAISSTELAPSYSTQFQRINTMEWLPRWMEPYYTNGFYRQFHYLALVSQREELFEKTRSLVPKFYGLTSSNRLCFVAKYKPKNILANDIVVNHSGVEIGVTQKDSFGSFLAEDKDPVYYLDSGSIYLKNIANHTYLAYSASAYVSLATAVASGIVEDSYILIENSLGDRVRLDQDDILAQSNQIYTGDDQVEYLINYECQDRYLKLLADTSYVLVNSERVSLIPINYPNDWDSYAKLFQLNRNKRESNLKLKARCQYQSLANKPQERIASALGKGAIYYWDTTTSLNLNSSGFYTIQLPELPEYLNIKENPIKYNNQFLLTSAVASSLTLILNGRVLPSEAYSVTGNVITPLTSSLLNSNENVLEANYRIKTYTKTLNSSGQVTANQTELRENFLVFTTKNVKIINKTDKIKSPKWNVGAEQVGESAIFEG